jgi:hypothetical protein
MRRVCVERVPGRGALVIAALVVAVVLGAPTEARADDPPEDIPAVGAYVELVPTAGGSRQAGRRSGDRALPLSSTVSRRLGRMSGPDARLLERIATATELGAPSKRLKLPRSADERPAIPQNESALDASLGAIGRAAAGGSDTRLLFLLGLIGAITLAAVAAANRRGRGA